MPNTLKESTQRKKVVKAWLYLERDLSKKDNFKVFNVYIGKNHPWDLTFTKDKVVECTITYNISK